MSRPTRRVIRRGNARAGKTKTWRAALYGPATGKTGTFQCQYKDPRTGKWTTVGRSTLAEAERAFEDIERLLDDAGRGLLVVEKATVGEAAARYVARHEERLKRRDVRTGTADNAERICRLHIVPVIGSVLVTLWDVEESQRVIDAARAKGYKDLAAIRKTLSGIATEARRKPVLLPHGVDPVRGVVLPRARGGRQGASKRYVPMNARPDTRTVRRLVAAAWLLGKRRKMPWISIAIRLAAYCGIRFSELMALRAKHYDPVRRILTVERSIEERRGKKVDEETKNSLTREVPVPATLHRALSKYVEDVLKKAPGHGPWPLGGPDGLLFPSPTGKPWSRNYWRLGVYLPLCLMIGWTKPSPTTGNPSPRMRFHALRHHTATWWSTPRPYGPGLSWDEISVQLGHSSVAVTLAIYEHPSEHAEERIRESLDRF